MAEVLSFRLSPEEVEFLDRFSEEWGVSRSDVLRRVLQVAHATDWTMNAFEFRRVAIPAVAKGAEDAYTEIARLSAEGWEIKGIVERRLPMQATVTIDVLMQRRIADRRSTASETHNSIQATGGGCS